MFHSCNCVQRSLTCHCQKGSKLYGPGLRDDLRRCVAVDPRTSKGYANFTRITMLP